MKIVQLNKYDIYGGAAKVAYRLHNCFLSKGHNSIYLVNTKESNKKGIEKVKEAKNNRLVASVSRYLGVSDYFLHKGRFASNQNIKNADVVLIHNLHRDFYYLHDLIELSRQKKVFIFLHDMWMLTGHCAYAYDCNRWQVGCGRCPNLSTYPSMRFDLTRLAYKMKKNIYGNCNLHLISPSQWLLDLAQKSILSQFDISLVKYGIDTSVYKPRGQNEIRKKLDISAKEKVIGFVGQGAGTNPRKGFEYLKQAFGDNSLKKHTLLEIGVDPNDRGEFLNNNHKKIDYLNSDRKLADYYSVCDVLVLTSLADNSPLVVLEAMACGVPVVAFDVGGVSEVIDHKKNGYVARYKNSSDVVGGLNFVLKKTKSKKIGKLARDKIKKEHDLLIQTKKMFSLFQESKNPRVIPG